MDSWSSRERAATVALLWRAGTDEARRERTRKADETGSALAVLRTELGQPTLMDDPVDAALAEAEALIEEWETDGITVLTFGDERYPARLRGVHDMPGVLFAHGTLRSDDRGIAVVGSRQASDTGLRTAHALGRRIAERGITVISGLAAGIDTAAHRGALEASGRTVGVLGTGLRHTYPLENRQLHSDVAASGALLSQFWPDTRPDKHTFPARNATMSGYALATVIVEAGERSGARIQARQAVEHGRPVLLLRSVLHSTDWGRKFASLPDVHVVEDASEALSVLDGIADRPHRMHDLLSSLAARL